MDALQLLGGLSAADFLRDYWQKRPLLIRQAIPDFESPLSPEELAGLACEDDVESRIVRERVGKRSWVVQHGPFEEGIFRALPERNWTLLVQDVEKHLPALGRLLEGFRFLPDWRIDDLMISYAAPQGSVGPHVDQYDVFLLQGHGRRRWQIAYPAPGEERLLPDIDLRILADFTPTDEWILEPGDMLYLPPGVPHHGVAVDACMTYSVGFRAPDQRELLTGFIDELLSRPELQRRFRDPGLPPTKAPGELTPAAVAGLRELLEDALRGFSPRDLNRWLGRHLTEPKPLFADKALEEPYSPTQLLAYVQGGASLQRNPASRFAFIREDSGTLVLFLDGEDIELAAELAPLGEHIANSTELTSAQISSATVEFVTDLVNRGHLLLGDDDNYL